jgi:hypothetical protein
LQAGAGRGNPLVLPRVALRAGNSGDADVGPPGKAFPRTGCPAWNVACGGF